MPYQVQVEGICKVLDGVDLVAILPMGMGNTIFISMYMLVVPVIKEDPTLCPNPEVAVLPGMLQQCLAQLWL